MPPDPTPSAAARPPKAAARWEDFIDIFYAPSSVFRRREKQSFWVPWLIVSAMMTIVLFATLPAIDPIITETANKASAVAAAKHPGTTEASQAMARTLGQILFKFALVAGTPFLILGFGLLVWLMGKLFFKSAQTLNAACLVVAYAFLPKVLGAILTGLQALVMDMSAVHSLYRLSLGPARFFDPARTSEGVLQLLSRFDPFTLWTTVLIGVGYAVTGKMSRAQATIGAIAIWGIGSLLALLKLATS